MSKNTGKNISKNLSSIDSKKFLDHAKQSATDALKIALKSANQNTVKATGGLICDTIVDRIKKASKISPQNSSEIWAP